MIDKELIKSNFSKCAPYYDRYSSIQKLCAARLITKIKNNGLRRILEPGCGTGNYTRLLRERFPQAQIKAIDISFAMAGIAEKKIRKKGIEFIIADVETMPFKEKFDLISSNASFQWFEDLESTLVRYRDLLHKQGLISFSIFGPQTFSELSVSLRELLGEASASIAAEQFMQKSKIKQMLKKIFKDIELEQKLYREENAGLIQLLEKIKYTGIRGMVFDKRGLWTSAMLKKLEKIYRRKFRTITATYEVFFCKGLK